MESIAKKSLGNVIRDLKFLKSEFVRLGVLLNDKTSLPYQVLSTQYSKINEAKFWASIHKDFLLHGFRPGKAKMQIFQETLKIAKNPQAKNIQGPLRLYKRCVIDYINYYYKELNNLLLDEKVDPEQILSTEDIFKLIIKKTPLYKVPDKQISGLYEIWGFERVDYFDELLKNKSIDLDMVNQIISKEESQFEQRLKKELTGSVEKEIKLKLTNLKEEINSQTSSLVEKKCDLINLNLKKELAELKRNPVLNEDFKKTLSQLTELSTKVNSLEKLTKEKQSNGHLSNKVKKNKHKEHSYEIIKLWVDDLKKHCSTDSTLAYAIFSICMLKSSQVIIVDRFDFLQSLIDQIYNYNQIKQISTHPSWINKNDWEEGVTFIESERNDARLLIINDYDKALQECYLRPVLIHWLNNYLSPYDKIILVSAEPDLKEASSSILELGLYLPNSGEFFKDLDLRFKDIDINSKLKQISNQPVNKLISLTTAHTFPLEGLIRNQLKISLSKYSSTNFNNLYFSLKLILNEREALRVAYCNSIGHWIKKKEGTAPMRILEEQLMLSTSGSINA